MTEKFLWGAASSSHQVEGGNQNNDWWEWEEKGNCENGARSEDACDYWNRFREDLKLAQEIGLNAYRFSIEWSRVQPTATTWDEDALKKYDEILACCEAHGLVPMVTLHHFTHPRWFSDRGGWISPDSSEIFSHYALKVVARWSGRVRWWCTFNEPMVLALGSYAGGFMPPGIRQPHLVADANLNLLEAHRMVYSMIHEISRSSSSAVMVGIAHNMLSFQPGRWWNPVDWVLARLLHRFYNCAWLDALTGKSARFHFSGIISKKNHRTKESPSVSCDYLGINYYTKALAFMRVRRKAESQLAQPLPFDLTFRRPDDRASDLDWAIDPEGFRRTLKFAALYKLPMVITENGIATQDDSVRTEFIKSHVGIVNQLRRSGTDIRGYFYWSLTDNFEWIKGFAPRFGLIAINYVTQERKINSSAFTYQKIISDGR